MNVSRIAARLFASAVGACLFAGISARAQDPGAPLQEKAAPIVRSAPPASPAAQTGAANAPTSAPKPIHLTVARPVVKTPATNADGTPAGPKAVSKTQPAGAGAPPASEAKAKKTTKPAVAPLPQGTAPIAINRTVIVLDPAHGGADFGSRISDSLAEKDVTLALAFRLRSLLAARGFSVVMTRENDLPQGGTQSQGGAPAAALTLDDRAGIANHTHAVACLLLHATASGEGVHLYSSELDPVAAEPVTNPWLTAQAAWVPASRQFVNQLGTALSRARLPLVQSRASVRPVDSLTCPAVVLELAPESAGNTGSLSDEAYQRRVAEAVAGALVFWQNMAQAPPRVVPLPPPTPPPAAAVPAVRIPEAQP